MSFDVNIERTSCDDLEMVTIQLSENGKAMGECNLVPFVDEKLRIGSYICSYVPKRGVPRKLVEEAATVLSSMATSSGISFEHLITFTSPGAVDKITHLVQERGYVQRGSDWVRTYFPESETKK